MRLMGIPVSDLDCEALIDLLLQVGRVAELELAARIDRALDANVYLLACRRQSAIDCSLSLSTRPGLSSPSGACSQETAAAGRDLSSRPHR